MFTTTHQVQTRPNRTFAYLYGQKLTIRRENRGFGGRRYDLYRVTEASRKRLVRVLTSKAFTASVELDDDFSVTVYFHSVAARLS